MDAIRNSDVRVPSGFEVESASAHLPSADSGWKDRAMSKVVSIRGTLDDKMTTMKPKAQRIWQQFSMRASELRRNPAVIAGISGAAGLALGLAGRWMRHRNRVPTLMIVEV